MKTSKNKKSRLQAIVTLTTSGSKQKRPSGLAGQRLYADPRRRENVVARATSCFPTLMRAAGFSLAFGAALILSNVAYAQGQGTNTASSTSVQTVAPGTTSTSASDASATGGIGAVDATRAQIARGHYLATAADCAACHTAAGGQPFAGGYPIASPLGTIFSSNITPSRTAGIGEYSEEDFAKALRLGVRRDGSHLYPAMPYPSYAGLSDADVAAMYAYFMHGVTAVDQTAAKTSLPFPFNVRASMGIWNMLFLHRGQFVPDPARSAEVNRGAYLVDNLAHCAECHTPRNALMALDKSADLTGSPLGSWYAPNITSDPYAGIGAWSDAQLRSYLKTGRAAGVAQAAGPMAEAVTNSLQYLPDDDVNAIIAYLHTVKNPTSSGADHGSPATGHARSGFGSRHSAEAQYRGILADGSSGAQLYSGTCAACHRADGSGSPDGAYPALFGNTATGANTPNNLVATILFGVDRTVDGKQVLMPGFGPHAYVNSLSYQEIAELSNYVLTQYGNPAVRVSVQDVADIAAGGPKPFIAKAGAYTGVVITVIVIVIVLLALWIGLRVQARKSLGRNRNVQDKC